jgi:hypothetical protein
MSRMVINMGCRPPGTAYKVIIESSEIHDTVSAKPA